MQPNLCFPDVATSDAFGHPLFRHHHRDLLRKGGLLQKGWPGLQGGDEDSVQVRRPGGRDEEVAPARGVARRVRGEESVAVGEARDQVRHKDTACKGGFRN